MRCGVYLVEWICGLGGLAFSLGGSLCLFCLRVFGLPRLWAGLLDLVTFVGLLIRVQSWFCICFYRLLLWVSIVCPTIGFCLLALLIVTYAYN